VVRAAVGVASLFEQLALSVLLALKQYFLLPSKEALQIEIIVKRQSKVGMEMIWAVVGVS
jgi:hypothetical protein